MGYGGGGGGGGGSGGSGSSGGSGYRRVGDDRTANLFVDNIAFTAAAPNKYMILGFKISICLALASFDVFASTP